MENQALHPTRTTWDRVKFDIWLERWTDENSDAIAEYISIGVPKSSAGSYFEAAIGQETYYTGDKRVEFTDDMQFAKERVNYHYGWMSGE